MARDIQDAVSRCAHCRVGNLTSHEAQSKLKTVMSDCPFDVVAFDVWTPGEIPSTLSPGRSMTYKKSLTSLDVMTGFAHAMPIEYDTSHEIARVMFTQHVSVFGLPKLVIVDAGLEFAGLLKQTCEMLGIDYHAVS